MSLDWRRQIDQRVEDLERQLAIIERTYIADIQNRITAIVDLEKRLAAIEQTYVTDLPDRLAAIEGMCLRPHVLWDRHGEPTSNCRFCGKHFDL